MIPKHRILVQKDKPKEVVGSLILPSDYVKTYTGLVVESGIKDIPIGSHVALRIETPEIEVDGKKYFSAAKADIILVN